MKKNSEAIRRAVRENYGRIAQGRSGCCGPAADCCDNSDSATALSRRVGYSAEEIAAVPEGANLGLGCGNPVALAELKPGQTVLDLGSGAGFDAFLAARRVGPEGRVIGVDMTPEMVEQARAHARKAEGTVPRTNVEFRLGEIEHLPVPDNSVDVVISNCVVNLSLDKPQVFREALRVLKAGGRLFVSDIVLEGALPAAVRDSIVAYVGCVAGADLRDDYLAAIRAAGFRDVKVLSDDRFPYDLAPNDPNVRQLVRDTGLAATELKRLAGLVHSLKVSARKPVR